MEILMYGNVEKDCLKVAVINYKTYAEKIKNKPEDYIFILSPEEWNKFMEFNSVLQQAILKKQPVKFNEADYPDEFQGILLIASVGLQREFVVGYKIGHFTHAVLGPAHAVYFISRSASELERSNEVLKRIKSFKANTSKDKNKQN